MKVLHKMICKNCRHWSINNVQPEGTDEVQPCRCHRFPMVYVNGLWQYPQTFDHDWCGEFKDKR